MSTDVLERSDTDLEEMLEGSIPCGGVKALGIPPCGREATLRLVRSGHCPVRTMGKAAFKCNSCYQLWLQSVAMTMALHKRIVCIECGYVAHTLTDFARYEPM